jgi:hypothetical protein
MSSHGTLQRSLSDIGMSGHEVEADLRITATAPQPDSFSSKSNMAPPE